MTGSAFKLSTGVLKNPYKYKINNMYIILYYNANFVLEFDRRVNLALKLDEVQRRKLDLQPDIKNEIN
jgi:hypothetical protein